ncbi:MAG: GAF domain-containing protein [Chloroflexi bacterium]|nr:GAF domain-containing protein [Chloroflexota bacterium]
MPKPKQTWVSAAIERLRGLTKEIKQNPTKHQQEDPALLDVASRSSQDTQRLNNTVREREIAQTLLDTIEALSSMPRLDQMPDRVLVELQRVVPYDGASINLIREEHCWTIASRGERHTPSRRFALKELPLMQRVVQEQKPVIIPDMRDEPDWSPGQESSLSQSWMGTPMIFKDRVVGVLAVDSHTLNMYDKEASRLALAFAYQVAQTLESTRLYEQTQIQLREASLLRSVTTALSSTLNASQILPYVARSLCEILHSTSVEIYSWDKATQSITVIASYVTNEATREERRSAVGQTQSLTNLPTTTECLKQRYPLQIQADTPKTNPDEQTRLKSRGAQTTLLLPMIAGDRTLGFAQVWESLGSRRFSDGEIATGQTLVHQAAIAIDHARLFEETQRRVRELRLLHDVGLAAASGVRIEETLQAAAVALATELEDVHVSILLQDPESNSLYVQASSGYPSNALENLKFGRDEGIVGRVTQCNEPILVSDVHLDSDYVEVVPSTRSELCVPLSTGPHAIGILNIESSRPHAFTENDQQLLNTLANNLALLVERARLFEEVETARVELQDRAEALEQANVRLQELDRLKSQFLANMSHELRTPLNSIIGFSEVLIDGLMGEMPLDQKEFVQDIYSSGRHLLTLINDILDLSKIEAGHVTLEPIEFDMAELLVEVQMTISPLIAKKSQVLDANIANDMPPLIADRFRIKQVLLNLLSNANKFTPKEGHITISCHLIAPDTMIFSLVDNGIGIKPEDLDIIFEEFRQADGSSARESSGTGLGLTISKRLIEMHGGRIWAESEYEQGTTFNFLLPLAGPPLATPIDETTLSDKTEPFSRDKTALVIENDRQFSNLLALYLQQEGYTSTQHYTGTGALEQAQKLRPTLITLDMILSNQNSREVLYALKSGEKTKDIPVLITSAPENAELETDLGAIDYLTKPVHKGDLFASISRLTQKVRVLLVDDDPEIIAMLQAMLPVERCTSLLAYGGDQALAMAQRERPDAIFLDLMMPGLSGFAVLEKLRADPETADIPVIVLTAKDVSTQEHTRIDDHIQGLMYKTKITPQSLLAALRRLKVMH